MRLPGAADVPDRVARSPNSPVFAESAGPAPPAAVHRNGVRRGGWPT